MNKLNKEPDIISYKSIHIKPLKTSTVKVIVTSRKNGTIKNIDRTLIED